MDTTCSTHNSIEHVDSEEPNWPPLPTNPAVATLIPNYERHSIKWTINQIPTQLEKKISFDSILIMMGKNSDQCH